MQFMLLIYTGEPDAAVMALPPEQRYAPWIAYTTALREAGAMVAGSELAPASAATTVRVQGSERRVQDGPYANTKEQLGGYYLIEAAGLDQALDWAAKCPAASYGAIEVRPLGSM